MTEGLNRAQNRRHRDDEERRRQALKDLERATADSEVFGTSALKRHAERAAGHFSGADADPGDRIEVWGRRIGRVLSLIGVAVLLVYLALTYVL